ncbi:alpha/beta hydrolase [Plantactinospora sp. S1510]|uniref:Alpha/beta hydrolase n=1 Tax=Plantactinospora alkalitolerans TaxID=2789879 RepID=A0ABS0GZZ3_9ACTN|nr:alpha/beta hydrolase [Plantactinospora alkalitolerans]MBF9131499.1 alpha/beta hydrolase [Plantactinospora alkalitolerans]
MRKILSWLRSHRRWFLTGAAIVAGITMLATIALRQPSPVGHFTSAQGQDRYLAAYDRAMDEMPDPDRTLDIRTSYGVVRLYHFAGADPGAPPLLLLPGTSSGSPVWADNMPSLLRVRSVYTVDLLGEPGLSIQQRPISSPRDHARWLHEVVVNLPEERVYLLGLSIGGWTAMNLTVHQPEKVAGVIVLDPVMVFANLAPEAIIRSIPASVRWLPKSWRDSFASWTANDAPVEDVPVARMIEAGMQTYAMKLSAPTRLTEQQLEKLQTPTLALIAGKSRMHDAASAAEVARRALPHGTVKVYPEASHAINGEHPDQIASDVATFLGDAAGAA